MPNDPTLYDLFDASSLQNCERLLNSGEIPTPEQLADIIENVREPLPRWFNQLVAKGLRGELKQKRGRPKESVIEQYRFMAAAFGYKRLLRRMSKCTNTSEVEDGSSLRGKQSRCEPAHERAAKIVIKKWRLHMSWRAFLNRVSSEK